MALTPLNLETMQDAAFVSGMMSLLSCKLDRLREACVLLDRVVDLREQEQHLRESLSHPDAFVAPKPEDEETVIPRPVALNGESTALPWLSEPSARKPMRPPRPGTTRAIVYQLLAERQGEPMERAQIVAEVARIRGVSVESCRKSVAVVLENKFDPHLEKIAHGKYSFRAAGA